jgi:hypothetical protein
MKGHSPDDSAGHSSVASVSKAAIQSIFQVSRPTAVERCYRSMIGHGLDMHLPRLLLLPFRAFESGMIASGIFISIWYAIVLLVIAALVYEIVNYVGVAPQVGEANVTRRLVPAHWEWQSRGRAVTRVYVEDYEVLDLVIDGQKIVYRPIPWIMERAKSDTTVPVEYATGRLNGKKKVRKFMYL